MGDITANTEVECKLQNKKSIRGLIDALDKLVDCKKKKKRLVRTKKLIIHPK